MSKSFFIGYLRLLGEKCCVTPVLTSKFSNASFSKQILTENAKFLPMNIGTTIRSRSITNLRDIQKRSFCDQTSATSFHVQDYDDFKERVLSSDRPIVVDFFADWCGPCKLLAPRLESIVDSKGGEVLLAKVNVDDNTELAMEYGVRSVPTVIGFKDGHIVNQFVGLSEDEDIKTFLNNLTNE